MRDDDVVVLLLLTILYDNMAVVVSHFQAINHHQCSDCDINITSAELQHLVEMCVFEEEGAVKLVVLFVERAACDEDSDSHRCKSLVFNPERFPAKGLQSD